MQPNKWFSNVFCFFCSELISFLSFRCIWTHFEHIPEISRRGRWAYSVEKPFKNIKNKLLQHLPVEGHPFNKTKSALLKDPAFQQGRFCSAEALFHTGPKGEKDMFKQWYELELHLKRKASNYNTWANCTSPYCCRNVEVVRGEAKFGTSELFISRSAFET